MTLFRQLSIRDKLTLALGGAAVLAFAVASAALALFGSLTLEGRARQIMAPYAQLISVGAGAAVDFEDPVRAEEILATLRANPQFLEAEIVLRDGRSLARYTGTKTTFPPHPFKPDGVYLTRNRAELIQSLSEGAQLHLVMSLGEFNRQTRNVLLLLAAGGLVLVVATALGLRAVLQRTIVGPISTLAETVGQVRTLADYHQRVPDSGTDEVARLGRSFNDMMVTIQERDEELRSLTLFQRTILDNVAYGIISAALDGIVTSFNPAAERLIGYSADEVVGKLTPTDWHDPDEMAQRALELSEELGEPVAPGFDVFAARPLRNLPEQNVWTFVRKDGTRVPVLLSVTALRDGGDRITGLVGLTYDLTERKQAEEKLSKYRGHLEDLVEERTAELEAANKELEAFAYSVSHDLRAPLRHIDGFLELLQKKTAAALDEQGRHYMDTIADAAQKMGRLIDNLLSFSRMGRQAMSLQPVALESLVREVIRELAPEAAGRDVEWRIGELPAVSGDASLLRMVLVNLIANALKFTRSRQQARIEIGSLFDQVSEAVIFVRDNGVGFDMAYADKLFGVFQRLHRADEFEGTGIGLANVRRIISRHGGRTWAEGQSNQGATFYFSLPLENKEISQDGHCNPNSTPRG